MVRAPIPHFVNNDYKFFKLLSTVRRSLQRLLYLGPDTRLIVTTQEETPEVEAEFSDDFSWWCTFLPGPFLRFADILLRCIVERDSIVVKPSLAVPSG